MMCKSKYQSYPFVTKSLSEPCIAAKYNGPYRILLAEENSKINLEDFYEFFEGVNERLTLVKGGHHFFRSDQEIVVKNVLSVVEEVEKRLI